MRFAGRSEIISSLNVKRNGYRIEYKKGERMGSFGDFNNDKKRKLKKSVLEKKAQKQMSGSVGWQMPQVEIIKKGKKDW